MAASPHPASLVQSPSGPQAVAEVQIADPFEVLCHRPRAGVLISRLQQGHQISYISIERRVDQCITVIPRCPSSWSVVFSASIRAKPDATSKSPTLNARDARFTRAIDMARFRPLVARGRVRQECLHA